MKGHVVVNNNALLGPNIITEEQENISSELNISRVSAKPPAVRKDFCPLALLLLPNPSSCDGSQTNSENGMFGNSAWHLC
jgi:hypothetical protein